MTPTYINILNVYAFCNTHDITWGTKGDDKAEKLPSATTKPGGKVDVNIPTDEGDLNSQYESELRVFSTKFAPPPKAPSAQDKQEDYYKGFRSSVVLAWMFSNLALCGVVLLTGGLSLTIDPQAREEAENRRIEIYMFVVLWSVAGLAAFRFIGAVWFLIVRMVSSFSPLLGICFPGNTLLIRFLTVPWRLKPLKGVRQSKRPNGVLLRRYSNCSICSVSMIHLWCALEGVDGFCFSRSLPENTLLGKG